MPSGVVVTCARLKGTAKNKKCATTTICASIFKTHFI